MEIKVAAFEIKLLVKGKGCSGPDHVNTCHCHVLVRHTQLQRPVFSLMIDLGTN